MFSDVFNALFVQLNPPPRCFVIIPCGCGEGFFFSFLCHSTVASLEASSSNSIHVCLCEMPCLVFFIFGVFFPVTFQVWAAERKCFMRIDELWCWSCCSWAPCAKNSLLAPFWASKTCTCQSRFALELRLCVLVLFVYLRPGDCPLGRWPLALLFFSW